MKNGIFGIVVIIAILAATGLGNWLGSSAAVARDQEVSRLTAKISEQDSLIEEQAEAIRKSADWLEASAKARQAEMATTAMWRQEARGRVLAPTHGMPAWMVVTIASMMLLAGVIIGRRSMVKKPVIKRLTPQFKTGDPAAARRQSLSDYDETNPRQSVGTN